MGKGGGGSISPGPLEKEQAKILRSTENLIGGPARKAIAPGFLETISGPGVFQTDLPSSNRDVIEQQFKQAQSNIMQNAPARGGQLNSQLGDLERARASNVSSAINNARQQGVERSLGLLPAFFPGAGSWGGGVAAEQQRNAANAQIQQQQQAQTGQAVGSGLQLAGTLAMLMML